MTIRITPDFTLRRVAGQLAVSVSEQYGAAASTTLTAAQARDAAEAFTIMAVMMDGSAVEGVGLEIADPEFEGAGVWATMPPSLRQRAFGITSIPKLTWPAQSSSRSRRRRASPAYSTRTATDYFESNSQSQSDL